MTLESVQTKRQVPVELTWHFGSPGNNKLAKNGLLEEKQWSPTLRWSLQRVHLQGASAAFLHIRLSVDRARYGHKQRFCKNFRSRIWQTPCLNESLTDIRGTKLNKHKNCSCLPAAAEMQLFEMQNPPSGGRPANSLTIFLAAISLSDLHVLRPKRVETEFQDDVPRNSIKGVVMYHHVKNTNYSFAGKLAKYCLLQSANIYEYSWGSSALQEKSESSGYIMFRKIWAKTCFSHSISRKVFCFSHRS